MPKEKITFISDFLLPSLNEGRFGEKLMWLDKKEAKFQLYWNHKAAPNWSEHDVHVFVEWDKQKGHYHPVYKDYYSLAKQRFRALLYKLTMQNQLRREKSHTKNLRIYSIIKSGEKEHKCKFMYGVRKENYPGGKFEESFASCIKADETVMKIYTLSSLEGCQYQCSALEDHQYDCNKSKYGYVPEDQIVEQEVLHSPSSPSLYSSDSQVQNSVNPDICDSPSAKEMDSIYINLTIQDEKYSSGYRLTKKVLPPILPRTVSYLSQKRYSDITPQAHNSIPSFFVCYNLQNQEESHLDKKLRSFSENKVSMQEADAPNTDFPCKIIKLLGQECCVVNYCSEVSVENEASMNNFENQSINLQEVKTVAVNESDLDSFRSGGNETLFADELKKNESSDIISDVSLSAAFPLNGFIDEQMPQNIFAWPNSDIPS